MRVDLGALVGDDIEEAGVLVREAVVVLPPDGRGDQQVQRGDIGAPGQLVAFLQPLGVLVEHRVDDVDEGLVGREEAVPAGQQVAFEPALERVLAEHLHDAAVGRQIAAVGVLGEILAEPGLLGDLVDRVSRLEAFSSGPKTRKFSCCRASMSRRKLPSDWVVPTSVVPGFSTCDGVVAEVRQAQRLAQQAAVGVRVGAHPPRAFRGKCPQLRHQRPFSSKSSSG